MRHFRECLPFACPNCGAQYKLVRVETNEILPDQQLTCRQCGGRFEGARAGSFSNTYWWIVPVEGLLADVRDGSVTHLLRWKDSYGLSQGTLAHYPICP